MLSNLWHIGDRLPLIQMFEDGRFCLSCRCADRLEKDIFSWKTLIFCGSMESAANRSYKKNFRTILIRPDRNAQHSRSKTTFNGSGSSFVNIQTEQWQTGFHHFSYLRFSDFSCIVFFSGILWKLVGWDILLIFSLFLADVSRENFLFRTGTFTSTTLNPQV